MAEGTEPGVCIQTHSWQKCQPRYTGAKQLTPSQRRTAISIVPTKEIKRLARGLVEQLETRVHAGPPVCAADVQQARDFLQRNEFSTASDYFNRLGRIQDWIATRRTTVPRQKRNYGGEAAGVWMQVQSVYDHLILSTCYRGEFNSRSGRVKISHRFNQAGRIDFVELKFLRSLQPCLNGSLRKLILVHDFQHHRKDWFEAEAYALSVLPRELVFLFSDIFRFPREEVLAWLINVGHRILRDLLADLRAQKVNGHSLAAQENPQQLHLSTLSEDEVALPILKQAAELEASVELENQEKMLVRYARPRPEFAH